MLNTLVVGYHGLGLNLEVARALMKVECWHQFAN